MRFYKKKLKKIEPPPSGHDNTVYPYENLSVVVTMNNPAPAIFSGTISIAARRSERSLLREEDVRGLLETPSMDLGSSIERDLGLSIGPCPFRHRFYYTHSSPINPPV